MMKGKETVVKDILISFITRGSPKEKEVKKENVSPYKRNKKKKDVLNGLHHNAFSLEIKTKFYNIIFFLISSGD